MSTRFPRFLFSSCPVSLSVLAVALTMVLMGHWQAALALTILVLFLS